VLRQPHCLCINSPRVFAGIRRKTGTKNGKGGMWHGCCGTGRTRTLDSYQDECGKVANIYSGHATPSLGWIWLPCGYVSCDPGCTHWRIVINACETWTDGAADGVRCARVRWEISFLLTFEIAPFFCVYPVYGENACTQCVWRIIVVYLLGRGGET
jgi:hypothetical protein